MKIERPKTAILIFTLCLMSVGALIGFFSTDYLKSGYKYSKNYTVSYSSLSQNFDPEDYTDSAVAVIQTPEFIDKLNVEDITVETKKIAPYAIKITTSSSKAGITQTAQEKIEKLFNEQSNSIFSQEVKINSIGQVEKEHFEKLNNKFMLPIGALIGLLCALVVLTITKILEI